MQQFVLTTVVKKNNRESVSPTKRALSKDVIGRLIGVGVSPYDSANKLLLLARDAATIIIARIIREPSSEAQPTGTLKHSPVKLRARSLERCNAASVEKGCLVGYILLEALDASLALDDVLQC